MQLDDLAARVMSYADANRFGDEPVATPVAGLKMVRSRVPSTSTPTIYRPLFCLVLQGTKQLVVGRNTLNFGRMESLVVSVDVPVLGRVIDASPEQPYVALALDLDMAELRGLVHEARFPAGDMAGCAAQTLAGDEQIVDAMRRLFALTERPEAVPVLRPLIVREIHYWLLNSRHGAMLKDLAHTNTHAAQIARAIARIKGEFTSPLRVAELARVAGMSVSAFHEHFRSVTGTTPLQFQKQLRLTEARHLLMNAGYSVSGAAFKVGYESPSQFSREYTRQFGVSPSKDLAGAMAATRSIPWNGHAIPAEVVQNAWLAEGTA
ncbi:AraC family transcriptional regulator [Arenibaculum pallidiluteum]|uniref:AraC family transcriptional regulator n=1 Tax=Arenibaculum pallidiluteum TaxID=2812559 RepID=UPI001A96D736|nr:AraC family transcriptional regulator N-terminal domain-containing protein [Arenibaculum pallidiluteum]